MCRNDIGVFGRGRDGLMHEANRVMANGPRAGVNMRAGRRSHLDGQGLTTVGGVGMRARGCHVYRWKPKGDVMEMRAKIDWTIWLVWRWFTPRWWRSSLEGCTGWRNWWCRVRGHPYPVHWYTLYKLEPDMRCRNCDEDLG